MQALDGLKVLDLTRVLAGPWCTQLLADLGADVFKIEKPGEGDDTRSWGPPFAESSVQAGVTMATYFMSANRGKQSVAIDIAQRVFDDAFKLAAIARLDAGEAVATVAQDLRVLRKDLYKWRAQVRAGGITGLHKRGRPPRGECPPLAAPELDELTSARARIAELERKIGQQQIDLDFFRGALRRVGTAARPIGALGATPSMAKSGT